MKYSIIIPTLNEEKLLEDLLRQLTGPGLNQKYEYEIIISDGGSTDNTVNIARNYADKLLLNNSGEKQNISQGRNAGIDAASGEILIFFNGDVTISDPVKLMDCIEQEFINSDYLAMTTSVKIFPEEEIFSDKIFLGFYNLYFHFLNIIGIGMGRGECHIIKKDVLDRVGQYSEKLIAAEDFDLYKRIRKHGKILFKRNIYIYESPRRYRKHGHLYIFFSWLLNSAALIFRNTSVSKEWEQVR
jgi:glycosyltransferase involved in cell wall biosynthesis